MHHARHLPMFVADGHPRYETACNYRDELASAGGFSQEHPANFVLTALFSMSDPGLVVLPTHRLIRGGPRLTTEQLHNKLGQYFDCELVAKGPQSAGAVWAELARLDEQLIMAIYSAESKEWTRITAKESAVDRMKELAPEHSSNWRELGVAVLHRLVFEDALGLVDLPKPTYVFLSEARIGHGHQHPGVKRQGIDEKRDREPCIMRDIYRLP